MVKFADFYRLRQPPSRRKSCLGSPWTKPEKSEGREPNHEIRSLPKWWHSDIEDKSSFYYGTEHSFILLGIWWRHMEFLWKIPWERGPWWSWRSHETCCWCPGEYGLRHPDTRRTVQGSHREELAHSLLLDSRGGCEEIWWICSQPDPSCEWHIADSPGCCTNPRENPSPAFAAKEERCVTAMVPYWSTSICQEINVWRPSPQHRKHWI